MNSFCSLQHAREQSTAVPAEELLRQAINESTELLRQLVELEPVAEVSTVPERRPVVQNVVTMSEQQQRIADARNTLNGLN